MEPTSSCSADDLANRSTEDSLTTADGEPWPLDRLGKLVRTRRCGRHGHGAPDPVLTAEHVKHCEPGTPVVDLANPADVSQGARELGDLHVADQDDLTAELRRANQSRQAVGPVVIEMLSRAIDRLVLAELEKRAEDALRQLHRRGAEIREGELERTCTRLEHSEEEPETVLAEFASELTVQRLADPTQALRDAAREGDAETIAATHRLFDLDGGDRR